MIGGPQGCLVVFWPTSLFMLIVSKRTKGEYIREHPRIDSPCPRLYTAYTAVVRHMPNVPFCTVHMPKIHSPCLLSA